MPQAYHVFFAIFRIAATHKNYLTLGVVFCYNTLLSIRIIHINGSVSRKILIKNHFQLRRTDGCVPSRFTRYACLEKETESNSGALYGI